MLKIDKIIIANTNTTPKEFAPYVNMAKEHNYNVVFLIVENRHGCSNIHNVPPEILEKMKNRFDIAL